MTYPFIQAVHYTKGRSNTKPHLVVIHTMETPESEGRASQVANWFAGKTAPQASAHYMIDDTKVLQSVLETDTAWAVDDWKLNTSSISLEHAGAASQTPAQWADTYSTTMLKLSATLAADIAKRNHIPVVRLSPADILAGKSGFCGHADITKAMNIKGGHSDPGTNFPWSTYIKQIQALS